MELNMSSHMWCLEPMAACLQLLSLLSVVLPQALSSMDVGGQQVYVPDERGCLFLAADLVYNDAPWLDSAGPSKAAPVVHPKISNEVLSYYHWNPSMLAPTHTCSFDGVQFESSGQDGIQDSIQHPAMTC